MTNTRFEQRVDRRRQNGVNHNSEVLKRDHNSWRCTEYVQIYADFTSLSTGLMKSRLICIFLSYKIYRSFCHRKLCINVSIIRHWILLNCTKIALVFGKWTIQLFRVAIDQHGLSRSWKKFILCVLLQLTMNFFPPKKSLEDTLTNFEMLSINVTYVKQLLCSHSHFFQLKRSSQAHQ